MKKGTKKVSFGIVHRWVAGLVSTTAFTVYAVLATYADRDRLCFPSMKTLARDLAMSESTIIRAVKELEGAYVIAVARRKRRDGSNLPNLYRIANDPEELKGVAELTPDGVEGSGISIPKTKTTWLTKKERRSRANEGEGKYVDLGWSHAGEGCIAKIFRLRDRLNRLDAPLIDWTVLDQNRDEMLRVVDGEKDEGEEVEEPP